MKMWKVLAMTAVAFFATAYPAFGAWEGPTTGNLTGGAGVGAGIAIGLVLIGAGWGFGRIGGSALESMARQPEVADKVRGSMIVIAALLEGATFFALLVSLLLVSYSKF